MQCIEREKLFISSEVTGESESQTKMHFIEMHFNEMHFKINEDQGGKGDDFQSRNEEVTNLFAIRVLRCTSRMEIWPPSPHSNITHINDVTSYTKSTKCHKLNGLMSRRSFNKVLNIRHVVNNEVLHSTNGSVFHCANLPACAFDMENGSIRRSPAVSS